MRRPGIGLVGIVSLAVVMSCSGSSEFSYIDHLPPPTLELRATSVDSGGVLKITTIVFNPTRVELQVTTTPECLFAVRIFPDSTGDQIDASGVSCAIQGTTTNVPPGDSVVLSRIFSSSDLTQYSAGQYGVNVTVATPTYTIGTWAGAVKLPLASKP